ncbi:acetyltransferase [Polychaeton citri CBS 116435]|uniref:Acetyltransferase n=1 Tax=Polychaeton citri CBS 116435 TaxID=1314669 RepID=A0A9P4UJT9_9PEZI|nr:acetyltransferase [Polychaeton citri CBS 116435]
MPPKVIVTQVSSLRDISDVETLFKDYAQALGIDLSFQDFEAELESLPGKYAPPTGALLLARFEDTGQAVGCVGLRAFDGNEVCEMKRLYVDPKGRGTGLGKVLSSAIVSEARRLRYRAMRLDSLVDMTSAQAIYAHLGFVEIPPYRVNPIQGARFFELDLMG